MEKEQRILKSMQAHDEWIKSKDNEIKQLKIERDTLRCSLEYLFEKKLVDKKFHDSYTLIEFVKKLYNA